MPCCIVWAVSAGHTRGFQVVVGVAGGGKDAVAKSGYASDLFSVRGPRHQDPELRMFGR